MTRERGFTLLELVVAMAVFGIFLAIIGTLTIEMRGQERRHPIDYMAHPEVAAVMFRLRRDVMDASRVNPYPDAPGIPGAPPYKQSSKVLIVNTMVEGSGQQTVVWDFSNKGEVRRIAYNVGVPTIWRARGLPQGFEAAIDAVATPGHPYGVRIKSVDAKGMTAIDQYLQPRSHD